MFRTIGARPSAWESLLPPEVLRLPEELARVDALLDDPVFFAPFAPYFHPVLGRPSTPAEWYLRLLFLKFRYRLGFETLCAEGEGSISGRRAHAIAAKLRSRAAQAQGEKQAVVARVTGELAGLAERAATDAQRLLANARRALRRAGAKAAAVAGLKDAAAGRRRGRLRRAVSDLTRLLEVTRKVAAQARQRLAGDMPDGASRRVSLHDGDARPIAKGRLGKPVEFGYKAQVTDNDDGIIADYSLEQGNPDRKSTRLNSRHT